MKPLKKEIYASLAQIVAEGLGLGRDSGTTTQRAFRAAKLDTDKTYKLKARAASSNSPEDAAKAKAQEVNAKGRSEKMKKAGYGSSSAGRAQSHNDERAKKK